MIKPLKIYALWLNNNRWCCEEEALPPDDTYVTALDTPVKGHGIMETGWLYKYEDKNVPNCFIISALKSRKWKYIQKLTRWQQIRSKINLEINKKNVVPE